MIVNLNNNLSKSQAESSLEMQRDKYTADIDQVFKKSFEDAEKHLARLAAGIEKEPGHYDNTFRNLKSYIDDLEELK